ncbi:MAG: hypothetical protein ABL888_06385 [Pirellulaceae bacterium]
MLHSETSISPRFTTPIHHSQRDVEPSLAEIQARVQKIKSCWSASERRQRALIGKIRRAQLLELSFGDDGDATATSAGRQENLVVALQ